MPIKRHETANNVSPIVKNYTHAPANQVLKKVQNESS